MINAKIEKITPEKAASFFEQSFRGKPLDPEIPQPNSHHEEARLLAQGSWLQLVRMAEEFVSCSAILDFGSMSSFGGFSRGQ